MVLFHHEPGGWALDQLSELRVPLRKVRSPERAPLGGPLAGSGLGLTMAELRQLRQARQLARALIDEIDPAAVVVIQDTLLLERFLVREANRRGRGTLVVQWAFTFPQTTYDLLNEIRKGGGRTTTEIGRPTTAGKRGLSVVSRLLYAFVQRILGVKFDLVRSYGGGEARVFAVMGETFRDQFLAQGVRKERIEVTGHPLHDAALAQRAANSTENRRELELAFGLPVEARVVLYASQPVLWRAVLTRAELAQNVRAIGEAVSELGPDFWLVIKLHPRESLDDYTSVAESGLPIRLVQQAEIAELIAACEAFISSSSSTVLLAMMLDKPIVTVNFNNVPHFDYYEKVGGTLHVKTREAIGQALRLVLTDEPTRARLAAERTEVLSRYARLDGRATERLAQLVLELCG
jgi:hypothetical protein